MKLIKLVEEKGTCSLPWVHTDVFLESNEVRPCVRHGAPAGKLDDGFVNVWNGEYYTKLRSDIEGDKYPSACNACSVPEGVFSHKTWKNWWYSTYFDFLQEIDTSDPVITPSVFHINTGNTCNLACRMCSPRYSSKLLSMRERSDKLKMYLRPYEKQPVKSYLHLKNSFKHTRAVTVCGGEPFLYGDLPGLFNMIGREADNLTIVNISSNLTVYNKEILDSLAKLSCMVAISVSIDGPKDVHEYIRYGSRWDTIKNNLKLISQNYPMIYFSVNITLSALTVGRINELFSDLEELAEHAGFIWQTTMISPVTDKPFLHPSILPDDIKSYYMAKLRGFDEQKYPYLKGNNVVASIEHLLSQPRNPQHWVDFQDYIKEFDSMASTDVLSVYPEFKDHFTPT